MALLKALAPKIEKPNGGKVEEAKPAFNPIATFGVTYPGGSQGVKPGVDGKINAIKRNLGSKTEGFVDNKVSQKNVIGNEGGSLSQQSTGFYVAQSRRSHIAPAEAPRAAPMLGGPVAGTTFFEGERGGIRTKKGTEKM